MKFLLSLCLASSFACLATAARAGDFNGTVHVDGNGNMTLRDSSGFQAASIVKSSDGYTMWRNDGTSARIFESAGGYEIRSSDGSSGSISRNVCGGYNIRMSDGSTGSVSRNFRGDFDVNTRGPQKESRSCASASEGTFSGAAFDSEPSCVRGSPFGSARSCGSETFRASAPERQSATPPFNSRSGVAVMSRGNERIGGDNGLGRIRRLNP